MTKTFPKLLLCLLFALFVLNLLQSYFTELINDEAYYWYYAQHMAWGYFDHPPMVAAMVKLGSLLFGGELGVRLMACVLSVGTMMLLWLLVDNERKREYIPHFFVLVCSMPLLHAYGFFTLPDTPLLFFTALFLYVYKRYINAPSIPLAILLGMVIAALMYSKYHAVLVIVFTLLSHLKLLTDRYAWLAVGVALLCYLPHFNWLYQHDFVSIKYHLFERPNRAYEFADFTLGYFINLVAIFGLPFFWIYKAFFKTKPTGLFTRALLYITYGVLLFFFVSSFNRRVQTQWIIVISIPIAILVFNYMLKDENTRKWIYRMGLVNIAVLLYLRLWLVYQPIFPFLFYETHGNKLWVNNLRSEIGDIPVLFENSYRAASMYGFYSGNPTFSLNNYHYRQNQYSIDDSEQMLQDKKVMFVSRFRKKGDVSYTSTRGDKHFGNYINHFESYRKLRCYIDKTSLALNTKTPIELKVYNPYNKVIDLKKTKFSISWLNQYKQFKEKAFIKVVPIKEGIQQLMAKDTTYFTFTLPEPKKIKDPGYVRIGISENGLPDGLNGNAIKLD